MDFKEKIKAILRGDYEFTEKEKQEIASIWRTEEDELEEYSDYRRKIYLNVKKREFEDEAYREWRKVFNCLNVTLNKTKKDGKDRSESIKTYLHKLEKIYSSGFDPCSIRKSRIDWEKSFEEERIVYRERDKMSEYQYKRNSRICVYEGKEVSWGALYRRLKYEGRNGTDADLYLKDKKE